MTPTISVIIASREEHPQGALAHLAGIDYPSEHLEILVTLGTSPGRQRNLAAAAATGEILYFLDDDSQVPADLLRRAAELFADPEVWGVCGPNLATAERSLVERCAEDVWTAFAGIGPKRARYCPVGKLREATDSDVIGCNLAVRRSVFAAVGGFDERFFPDEENDLVERLRGLSRRGLLYSPELVVLRPRPASAREYLAKIFVYGWARARRLGTRPRFWASLSAVPALLVLYLLLALTVGLAEGPEHPVWLPGLGYLAGAGCATAARVWRRRTGFAAWLALFGGCLATHLTYGLGQWFAVLHRQPLAHTPGSEVRLLWYRRL